MMGIVEDSKSSLLRVVARKMASRSGIAEGSGDPESGHQNPAWVRRCVASYIHKGKDRKRAPSGLDREDVSRAFAICTAQYKKLDHKSLRDASAVSGKKGKNRSDQYQKILDKVRKVRQRDKR